MADISAEITAFRSAVYGEDVRSSMISLANKLNTIVENGVESMISTFDDITNVIEYYNVDLSLFGFTKIDILNDGYINLTNATGIDLEHPVSSTNYHHVILDCSEGDIFVLNAVSNGSSAQACAFISSANETVALVRYNNVPYDYLYIVAPKNASKIVINRHINCTKLCYKKGSNLVATPSIFCEDYQFNLGGYVPVNGSTLNPENGLVPTKSSNWGWCIVPIEPGDSIEWCCFGNSNTTACVSFINGPNSDDPYKIVRYYSSTNGHITHSYHIFTSTSNYRWAIFNNWMSKNPGGFVRKLTQKGLDKLHDEALSINYYDLFGYYNKFCRTSQYSLASEDGKEKSTTGNYWVSNFIPVLKGDVVSYRLSVTDGSNTPFAAYDLDQNIVYTGLSGKGWNEPVEETYIVKQDGYVRFVILDSGDGDVGPNKNQVLQYGCYINISSNMSIKSYDNILDKDSDLIDSLYALNQIPHSETKSLNLLHFSDIHGYSRPLLHVVDFMNDYRIKPLLHDALCTGDLVSTSWSSTSFNFWHTVDGSESIMRLLGNHDLNSGDSIYKYKDHTIQEAYERYFYPDINDWNVVKDSNTLYPTYFYKDYSEQKIRLICLDAIMDDTYTPTQLSQQFTWFENVLADAITNEYAVIVSQHFPVQGTNPTFIQCNFNDPSPLSPNYLDLSSNYTKQTVLGIQSRVQTFIDNGGEFVCHLVGHEHYDYIYTISEYPDQLCVVIGRAKPDGTYREHVGTRDLFNVMVVNQSLKRIYLIRFGVHYTINLESRKTVCLNYETKQVLAQS